MKKTKKENYPAHNKIIGENIVRARLLCGLSQADIAAILRVTFQQVQKYETGANRLSALNLYILHRALGLPLTFFYEGLENCGSNVQSLPASPLDPQIMRLCGKIGRIDDRKLLKKITAIVTVLMKD